MSDELLDVLTESGEKTGKRLPRHAVHDQELWHASAHIWIYSPTNRVLMQKRAMHVENRPGQWDISSAGHIGAGEAPSEGAKREIKEELGITVTPTQLEAIDVLRVINRVKTINREHKEFWHVYFLKLDEDTNTRFDDDEVEAVKWLTYEEFLNVSKDCGFANQKVYYELIKRELIKRIGKNMGKV